MNLKIICRVIVFPCVVVTQGICLSVPLYFFLYGFKFPKDNTRIKDASADFKLEAEQGFLLFVGSCLKRFLKVLEKLCLQKL